MTKNWSIWLYSSGHTAIRSTQKTFPIAYSHMLRRVWLYGSIRTSVTSVQPYAYMPEREDDTIVQATPMINVDESDSGVKKNGLRRALCKFCNKTLAADGASGTSSLRRHNPCPSNPNYVPKTEVQQQTHLEFKKNLSGEGTSSLQTWKHDESRIKKALINMFVVTELPFKFVEHEVFVEYSKACNGRVVLPSRHKLSRDVSNYYLDERNKLATYLAKPTTTVHLTTDTWTSSCKKTNYMVVTAHFIDDEWNMHKRIINFRPINSHKSVDISINLLKCIGGWGIKNVMTMTVDNAPSNDKALNHLIKKLPNAKIYDEGKHFHIRCMAHILNLIVREGLKEKNYHVESVANAVKYIRYSSQRINNFKRCMEEVNLESKKFLCSECPTRWNSKHDMLKILCELREVFFKYELVDDCYYRDLERVPEHSDFGVCEGIVEFLEKFKAKTELISSSSKPLAHLLYREILDGRLYPSFVIWVDDMVKKYNKYWGKFDELNDYMYFATILDPTMKQNLVSYGFKKMLEYNMSSESSLSDDDLNAMVREMLKEVVNRMGVLFQTYKTNKNQQSCKSYVGDNAFLDDFLNLEDSGSIELDTELTRYLNEPRIRFTSDFDILDWWKLNAPRFPIVARMAKDILAIQITTVASESAFSTGGRVLDPYRTNLSYALVEALICTQDWVRKSKKAIIDDIDDLLNDDDVAKDIDEGIAKQNAKGKGMGLSQD
ncbi:zinc finger BED domain-containing protein RICESLEEPER 2 [Artemisia annua]|uniref:Zinc finger BED domain-containing protein RICESLEEPER 2 n=1 Tax=Artemisia annua TaxID=35608 RepID=A0A2U1L609_ARTAN|nr:zinc finger BED domain-containing protein RICESLEEPER 2 [Artemisia annua]